MRRTGSLGGLCDNPGGWPSLCLTASRLLRVIRRSSGQDLLSSVCVCGYQHAVECVFSLCIRRLRPNTVPGKGFHRPFLHNSVSDNNSAFLSTHITATNIFALLFFPPLHIFNLHSVSQPWMSWGAFSHPEP